MNPTHLTRQELYEELGKAQSRDSNTTNKKLRKEIVELKENVERLEGVNKTIAQERERYKQRMCELEAELVSVRDQLQQATDYVGELERKNKLLKRERELQDEY